jgi:hypothetical protein
MKLLLLTSLLFASTSAVPAAVFPFNSQVPTAARVSQLYSFQFSASTFAPGDAGFVYSLSGQPAWLTLDGASRTLTGTPGQSDTGSSEFILTAADITGAAHMQCTLVVVTDPIPTLQGDLGEQLAESTNLSSSDPPIMTLLPDSAFDFHFRQNSFIDIVQRNLYYYATLSDHTPLPSWLQFDGANLAFSGVAPQLSAFPQSFQIMLIASDVQGFAGSSSTFTIRIGERQLVFVPEEQDVKYEPGKALDEEYLGDTLLSNGVKVDVSKLKEVEIKGLPDWMTFDSKTLKLVGDAPDNARAANATLTVKDENGDTAVLVVRLVPDGVSSSLFTGEIGTLDATAGESFEYTIPTSVIAESDATLMLILPTEAKWLQFDSSKCELRGEVPTQTSSIITATLNARAPNSAESETLVFKIDIKAVASSSSSTAATTLVTSRASPTESPTSTAAALATDTESRDGLSGGAITGIAIGVILAVAILFVLLFLCCRRKRGREGYEKHTSTSKQSISRPIPVPETQSIAVTTMMQRDVEKAESMEEERAPQIALNLPPRSARNSKWTGRFSRVSLVSSLGNGEDMIRADSNIPEWGHDSSAVHQMPHESFSVPAQLARVSRQLSDLSPSKGALRRLRVKRERPQSEDDVGLGIGMRRANLSPHRAESRRKASSMGFEATIDRSSCGSFTTRGTSMFSTRPSDFPRPPTQESFVETRSFLVGADNKRKGVRLVPRSDSASNNDRTIDDNANDERSMQEKRQSFIRKRASTTLSSPLWSATIGTHHGNGQSSTSDIDVVSGANSRKSKRIKSQLTSYSESPSIQPSRSSNRISRRFRSSFAPNFPRAITRSTLAAEDDNEDNWTTSSESSSSEDHDRQDEEAEMELAEEMALPRHERFWVLPNEASPTPPPPSNHLLSSSHRRQRPPIHRASTPNSAIRKTKPWNTTASTATSSRSISPLAIQTLDINNTYSRSSTNSTNGALSSPTKLYPRSRLRRSRLSEPMALTATDSLSRVNANAKSSSKSSSKSKPQGNESDNESDFVTTDPDNNNNKMMKSGPRLAFTKSSRPISVNEDAKPMSSLRAELVVEEEDEEDVCGGALREEIERSLERSRVFTGGSGKVFI